MNNLLTDPEKIRKKIMSLDDSVIACEYTPAEKENNFIFIFRRKNDKRYGLSFDISNKHVVENILYNLKNEKNEKIK